MIRSYRKPTAICKVLPELEDLTTSEQVLVFARAEKKIIEQQVLALGLHLRLASQEDIDAIRKFQLSRFPEGTLLEDPYVLFRIVRFGYAPLIESSEGQIVACNLCQGHDDPERTLWGIRNAVDPSVSGANLAAVLANYSSLVAMERGSLVRRAFVSPTNYASAANVFNHVGFIAEAIDLSVPGHQGPRFDLVMPLSPAGIKNNRIDLEKTRAFIETHKAGNDYMTVAATNVEELVEMYARTPFRVVAFLRGGQISSEHAFFAVPEGHLSFPGRSA